MPQRMTTPRLAALALAAGALASLGPGAARLEAAPARPRQTTGLDRGSGPLPAVGCPRGSLPDGSTCVRLPDDDEGAPAVESAVGAHRDRTGSWVVYDQIPRRPDRLADYGAYRYPVPCAGNCVFSGYDLDQADQLQRRGRHLRHVGHGAIDISAPKGTPVVMVPLEHQQQDAEVVYVGPLFGTTVVTRHTVREAGVLRDYIVLFGHLDAPGPRLVGSALGTRVREGEILGYVGETGSPGLVHLHLEVRRVRDGVDLTHLSPSGLVDNSATVVCDPRNVLAQK